MTAGTQPAAAPPVPVIPPGSVVTIDTGFQGNIDFLTGPGAGAFVQGLPGSPFGQVAFANGPAFFLAARLEGVKPSCAGDSPGGQDDLPDGARLLPGGPGPVRQRDHPVRLTGNGQTAEQGSGVAGMLVNNGSDNLLLDTSSPRRSAAPASEFAVPSLSDPGTTEATQATDELLAGADQKAPVALVPPNDPMTTVGADVDIIPGDLPTAGNLSVVKTDLYRAELGQPLMGFNAAQDATQYCTDLKAGGTRVASDEPFEAAAEQAGGVLRVRRLLTGCR